jgi:hypothetical protein
VPEERSQLYHDDETVVVDFVTSMMSSLAVV